MTNLERLEAFKEGSWPYGQQLPTPEPRERVALDQAFELVSRQGTWRARHGHRIKPRRARERIWQAACSLPLVYGTPSCSPAVLVAVRHAKALARSLKPLPALLAGAKVGHVALADVVEAVLAMPGARSA